MLGTGRLLQISSYISPFHAYPDMYSKSYESVSHASRFVSIRESYESVSRASRFVSIRESGIAIRINTQTQSSESLRP